MISELSDRHFFRVLSAYTVGCFVPLQIAGVAFIPLGTSDEVLRWIIIAMLLSFPVVAYLAWVFDVTPDVEVKKVTLRRRWLEALFAIAAFSLFTADERDLKNILMLQSDVV